MKYIRLFNNVSEYNDVKDILDIPNVSCEIETNKVFYLPITKSNKVTVLYKTDMDNEEYSKEVDYEDWYQYYGTEDWNGETYYKWQKVSNGSIYPGYFILTSTKDFTNISIDNPYTPDGYIINDETTEGAYNSDLIVEVGEKEFIDLNYDKNNLTSGEYVDLGLPSGKLWASCNLGATSPCEYGNFYAWGETEPKDDYSWSTYKYGSNYNKLTKYCKSSSYGTVDNKTVLDNEDDAIYVATNGEAHMPTKADEEELLNNTTNRYVMIDNVFGRLFIGSNNNTLFIPFAGLQDGTSVYNAGDLFYVWSSSLYENGSSNAWFLISNSDSVNEINYYRYYGFSVRGVK